MRGTLELIHLCCQSETWGDVMDGGVVGNPRRRDGPAWRSGPEPGIGEVFSSAKRRGES